MILTPEGAEQCWHEQLPIEAKSLAYNYSTVVMDYQQKKSEATLLRLTYAADIDKGQCSVDDGICHQIRRNVSGSPVI